MAGVVGALMIGGCPGPTGDGNNNDNDDVDGGQAGAPTVRITVSPSSGIVPGATVTLDASQSTDPDGDTLAFAWSVTSGLSVQFSDASAAVTTFAAPLVDTNAELRVDVLVTDGNGSEVTSGVTLTIEASGAFAGNPQSTAPYRDELSTEEAYHFLRRTQFGAKPEEVAEVAEKGLAWALNRQFGLRGEYRRTITLADSFETDVTKRWLVHLIEGRNPLLERMTMFWHDRFATSDRVLQFNDANLAMLHWQMLRKYALGNYRDFLEALTLDPLMLIWLDGANSPKENPNENYAREFWELFTLGRDNLYTEIDIREGARAFTGITLLRSNDEDARPIFDLLHHDETLKDIFPERSDPFNHSYLSVIDLTLEQPEAARYVARNLFEFFVHDQPSDELLTELAEYFVEQDFEIKPLVRRILGSQAMFSRQARGWQIASPVEHWAGIARTLDMHMYSEESQGYRFDQIVGELDDAGQDLLNPPGVQGWDENTGWLQDQWMLNRIHALGRTMDYGPDRTEDLPYHLLPPVHRWDEREVREEMVNAMASVFHVPLSDDEREVYVEVLDQNGYLAFHLQSPEEQPHHVYEMIRLMAMDPRVIGR
jgi:hypothetical protein